MLVGCTPAPPPAQAPATGPAAADPLRATRIVLQWDGISPVEPSGLYLALLERGLGDLDRVVPQVGEVPPSPGLQRALAAEDAWRAEVEVAIVARTHEVVLTLCDPSQRCSSQRATAPVASPEQATAELLEWAALQLRTPTQPAVVTTWKKPLSGDAYAVTVFGRGAAALYGLAPEVPLDAEGDVRRDPIARAVFIDPTMAAGQWLLGRRQLARGEAYAAYEAFTLAARFPGASVLPIADLAAAQEARGRWSDALSGWDAIDALSPADPRYVVARANTLLRVGRAAEAREILDEAHAAESSDPVVLALRFTIAEALDPTGQHEALLADWQERAPSDPRPIRLRIAERVRHGEPRAAWALLPDLRALGLDEEADSLALALGIELGEWQSAALAAEALGLPVTSARILARQALEADPGAEVALDDAPMARVARGRAALVRGAPELALADADAALKQRPWMPEALALRGDALDAAGRGPEADRARAQARLADPELYPP